MTPAPLFVTGMLRSGTTLVDKLLSNHPQISILSQPFPDLFLAAKWDFLHQLGEARSRHRRGSFFAERRYGSDELAAFLRGYRPGRALLSRVLGALSGAGAGEAESGNRCPGVEALVDGLRGGDLAAVLAQLYRLLAPKPAAVVGGKEILCEEYLPYLLDRGFRCLVVVRDPRDVVASLNFGKGPEYGGRRRPTLYNVRAWRKSVAFVLHLRHRDGFFWVRYEDLVAAPREGLDRMARFLAVAPFADDFLATGIRDQDGKIWRGNSSHAARDGVSRASVGSYRRLLPAAAREFIEATCFPELRWLGYPVAGEWEQLPELIRRFEEPWEIEREELREYVTDPEHVAGELRRLELLPRPATAASRPYFLFTDVHDALRESSCGPPPVPDWRRSEPVGGIEWTPDILRKPTAGET